MKLLKLFTVTAVTITTVLSFTFFAHASTYQGGSVQGYASDKQLDIGTIVQLSGTNKVKAVSKDNLQNMFGVTVDRNQLPVRLSADDLPNEAYVAVSGTYDVLVSTQNGAIKAGDYVTVSSIDGVAMNAGSDEKTVFGRAINAFNGDGIVLGKSVLKDSNGGSDKEVALGRVPVTINIERNPNTKSTKASVPEFLQRLGQQIAEKKVSPIRIYLSLAITLISLVSAIAVIYSGVRNSIISIGRNPMSKKSIFRALLQIILTSILILIIGLFAVYLLLKL